MKDEAGCDITPWKEVSKTKVIDPKGLAEKIASLRKEGKTIATLNGSFDLLHAGHLYIIYEASRVADVLIVALNSDLSVKSYKSPERPIISLPDRIEMMTAIAFVDYVTWFDEVDPRQLLSIIRPDVHVNGVEYGPNCIEAGVVKEQGGRIHLVPRIEGLASSTIVKKIKSLTS